MTIRIQRNAAGNCIEFVGSSLPAYYNFLLLAQLNAEDPTRVDILNDARTNEKGNTEFEFYALDFNDYSDGDGAAFPSASAMVAYFNGKARALGYTTDDGVSLAGLDVDFRIDATETTILLSIGEYFPVNAMKAVADEDGTIHIYVLSDGTPINGVEAEAERYSELDHTMVSIDGVTVGGTLPNVVNELNALFYQTGNADGTAPVITSPATINLSQGDAISYSLTSVGAVEFEWLSLPNDLTVSAVNRRKLIGGSQLTAGTYNFSVKAYNYYGETTQAITLVVTSTAVANTRSVEYSNKDYAESTSSVLQAINSSNLWSYHLWFKTSGNTNNEQVLAAHGDEWFLSIRGSDRQLRFETDSGEEWRTANNVFTDNQWTHLIFVYSASGPALYVDGVLVAWDVSGSFASVGAFNANESFYVGRRQGKKYLRDVRVDEVALFNDDQSANVTYLYNSGATRDLASAPNPPEHWWRMGDGDTFPTISDNIGSEDLTLNNMTTADIVTDAP